MSPSEIIFANISINENLITLIPVKNGFGSQKFTVTANDNQSKNNLYYNDFNLVINPVNDAPSFDLSTDNIELYEDFNTCKKIQIIMPEIPYKEDNQQILFSMEPDSLTFANMSFDKKALEISICSVKDANGSKNIKIISNDNQDTNNIYQKEFLLNVEPVNDSPVFYLSSYTVTVVEDFTTTEYIYLTPIESPVDEKNEIYDFYLSPEKLDFVDISIEKQLNNTARITIKSIQNGAGSKKISIIADDGNENNRYYFSYLNIIVLEENDPPFFELDTQKIEVNEDFEQSIKIQIIPGKVSNNELSQTISYEITPTAKYAAVTFDQFYNLITIDSITNAFGYQSFTVVANDHQSHNNIVVKNFSLNIKSVNDPPLFKIEPDTLSLKEDFENTRILKIIPQFNEFENEIYSYKLNPSFIDFAAISIEGNEILIKSVKDLSGAKLISVISDDGNDYLNTHTERFALEVVAVNDPPKFALSRKSLILDQNFTQKHQVEVIPISILNETNETVTYSLYPSFVTWANIEFNAQNGLVSISSIQGKFGSRKFTVIADDHQGANNTFMESFSLTVTALNQAPYAFGDNVFTFENSVLTKSFKVEDPDSLSLSYFIVNNPIHGTVKIIDKINGIYEYTPEIDYSGRDNFTFKVNDGIYDSNTASIDIAITSIVSSPIISDIEDQSYYRGISPKPIEIIVSDADGGMLTVSAISSDPSIIAPDSIIFESSSKSYTNFTANKNELYTLKLNLIPTDDAIGKLIIKVEVKDETNLSQTSSFIVDIKEAPPIFVNFYVDGIREGMSPLKVYFISQVQGNASSIKWDFGDGSQSNELNPIHTYNMPGIYNVKLIAYGSDLPVIREKSQYVKVLGRKLNGRVIAQDSLIGLKNYLVEAWLTESILSGDSLTDENGYYTITTLPSSDKIVVCVWPTSGTNEYFSQYYNNKGKFEDADKISTISGNVSGINFILEKVSNIGIRGHIYFKVKNGVATVPGIQVDVFSEKTLFGKSVITNNYGSYIIEGLKNADDYRISVWSNDYRQEYYYAIPATEIPGKYYPDYSVLSWYKATKVKPTYPALPFINIIIDPELHENYCTGSQNAVKILKILAGLINNDICIVYDINHDNRINLKDVITQLMIEAGL